LKKGRRYWQRASISWPADKFTHKTQRKHDGGGGFVRAKIFTKGWIATSIHHCQLWPEALTVTATAFLQKDATHKTDRAVGLICNEANLFICQYKLCDAKCNDMESNWAADHLQTIRTLMERSALYRRALAPIMLFAGSMGVLAMLVGLSFHMDSPRIFCGLWLGTAVISIGGAFLIARRQALKDHEPFWSSPTRRVALALSPPLAAGMCLGALVAGVEDGLALLAALIWILFYGCALHSAGFFMPRGIRLFGWLFIISSCCLLYAFALGWVKSEINAYWLMGFFFGVLHLAYGAYLYLTEKGKNAA
jgi:hypothetical protein